MGKATDPPKCKTCGKIEWRHLCGGLPDLIEIRATPWPTESAVNIILSSNADLAPLGAAIDKALREGADIAPCMDMTALPKTNRKEYLKLKARERRAADKLGLSVAEYRARKAK